MDAARGGAEGLGADRLHHHLADDLADRGADPAAVHGRRRRPAVPRVRDHARGHHRHLRRRVADAGADAVRQAPAPRPRAERPLRAQGPNVLRQADRGSTAGAPGCSTIRRSRCWSRSADARAHRLLYVVIPKGFFPGPGHRRDPGHLQAAQASRSTQMAEHAAGAAEAILKDPDVESLSSFIGVDGTNVTLNSGRFLINLKPHDERKATASEIIRRLQQETAGVAGISLFMQPVQDLTRSTHGQPRRSISSRSRTGPGDVATWTPKLVAALGQMPRSIRCRERSAAKGRSVMVVIDRATAARFGITPATSTTRSTTPSASASSRPSSPSPTSTA
jgi:hypothetical protein